MSEFDRENEEVFAMVHNNPYRIDHLRELAQAEKDGRLVVLPCKVEAAIDKLFSHNEIIALWEDRPSDKNHSYLLWRGEAWRLPDKYKDQRILRIKGIVPEFISEADTVNLLVTPYIREGRDGAEAALKGGNENAQENLQRMDEFIAEYRRLSESHDDYFSGKADAMEVARRLVNAALTDLCSYGERRTDNG